MSHILPKPESSTSTEVEALTNLTELGNGYVKKTGTSDFEADDALAVVGVDLDGYTVFNFGSDLPTKLKCRDIDGNGWTYVTFLNGTIIASINA